MVGGECENGEGNHVRVLSVAEVMRRLGVSRMTVLRAVERGDLRARRKTPSRGSTVQIYADSVAEFERRREDM